MGRRAAIADPGFEPGTRGYEPRRTPCPAIRGKRRRRPLDRRGILWPLHAYLLQRLCRWQELNLRPIGDCSRQCSYQLRPTSTRGSYPATGIIATELFRRSQRHVPDPRNRERHAKVRDHPQGRQGGIRPAASSVTTSGNGTTASDSTITWRVETSR